MSAPAKLHAYSRWGWIAVLLLLIPFIASAAPAPTQIAPDIKSTPLIDGLQYYVDPSDTVSVEALLQSPESVSWQSVGASVPNFGFDKRTYWYRLSLQLTPDSPAFLLQVDNPLLDHLDVYMARGEHLLKSYHTGDMQPFSQRAVQNRSFIFPLQLDQQALDLYFRVSTDSPQRLPLVLWQPEAFDQQDRKLLMGHSFYFGIVFVMIIYNLAMYFSVRDFNYLLYVASVAAFALFDASMNGYTFQLLWPYSVSWNDKAPMFFLNLFILFRAFFAFHFLNLRDFGVWFIRLHYSLVAMTFVSLITVFYAPISVAIVLGLTLGFVGLLVGQTEGAMSWIRGQQHARFFVAGWSVFMSCLLIQLLANIGLLPVNTFTILATQIGSAIEVILFTFALADRVRLVHKERNALERQAKEALLEANKSLEASLRVKNDFLATISHELRTPMNGVVASLESILNSQNLSVINRFCTTGIQSAQEMMGMVEGILGYTEMQSGQFELDQVEFSLRKLCNTLKREFHNRAAARNLHFNLNVAESLPDRLMGDPRRLSQVLGCLLDNAIKFTPAGHIALTVDPGAQNPGEDTGLQKINLLFRVADSGIGVSEAEREHIFQKFHQADSSYHRNYGGLGLGLSISQTLVTALGGTLIYEPAPHAGSQFTVSLAFQYLSDRREVNTTRAEASPSHSARILIVEDNNVNQMVLKALLQKFGADVALAENGEEAVTLAQSQSFDLILMDLQMPVMDGFEATRRIRALENPVANVPIVAVTANVMDSDRKRCRECGMNDFVSKPVKSEKLNEVFAKWLRGGPQFKSSTII